MLQPTQPRPEDVARAILAGADRAAAAYGLAPRWEFDGVALIGFIPVSRAAAGLAFDAWRHAFGSPCNVDSCDVLTVRGREQFWSARTTVSGVPVRLIALTPVRTLADVAARRELVTA
jgi:hypothetical protein